MTRHWEPARIEVAMLEALMVLAVSAFGIGFLL